MWRKTGILSLRDAGMHQLPGDLLPSVGALVRTADMCGNQLTALPAGLASLTSLMRLRLSHNLLGGPDMQWHVLSSLQQLSILSLDHNR